MRMQQAALYLNGICDPMDADGYVHASTQPGLGDDINFEYIAAHVIS